MLNNRIKKAIKNVCIKVTRFSCGTASWNYSYQPKEPKSIKELINTKK